MLDCKRNRLDYGELLVPPAGYRLERAVGATYSADLNTLLSIPVALVYANTLEKAEERGHHQLLQAIEEISKRVTVYHQKGRLLVPTRFNRLYAFLEDMLKPVTPFDAFTSFHPKTWVLRYVDEAGEQPDVFRVLVMSRNLTFDRSWDVAVCLEGREVDGPQRNNSPLCDYLNHLNLLSPFPDAEGFIDKLRYIKFDYPEGFRFPQFHPIGFEGHYINPVQSMEGDRAVVLSPFVDDKTLSGLCDRVEEVHLFSRREELLKLKPGVLTRLASCYVVSRWVVEGESRMQMESENAQEAQEQDLHAKVFVVEKGSDVKWYLGSANATQAAQTRNTEFLVEFTGKKNLGRIDDLLNELLGPDRDLGVFEAFDPEATTGEDHEKEEREDLRRLEYRLMEMPVEASVVRQSGDRENFDLRLGLNLEDIQFPESVSISIRPLNLPESEQKLAPGSVNELLFENIPETDLTRFLVIEISGASSRRFLLRVEVKGMPSTRGDSIFKSLVNSQEKFFQYLAFLLSEDPLNEEGGEATDAKQQGEGADPLEAWQHGMPVYEQLLVTAARNPAKLKQVDALITRLRSDNDGEDVVVPTAFLDFWNAFRPLILESREDT
ncbi:phospholipase D family protein [Kiritimatiellota bacterium B12222]|nr:phospholipase D family protein [Kiritimatiellota bacterium B12222]